MSTVVITDHAFSHTEHEARACAEAGADLQVFHCTSPDETTHAVQDANVVLTNFAPMGRAQLTVLAPGATVIRYGVGVDNVDLEAAHDLGIAVANVPDYGISTVADHASAMLLALLRRLSHYSAQIRDDGWSTPADAGPLPSFNHTTIGLLGVGRISCALADRLSGFGFTFLGFDPYASPEIAAEHLIELADFEQVLSRSTGLSLHLPATPETAKLLDRRALALMPRGSVVVNTSRGTVIDEEALAESIRSGHTAGAGLDVFDPEPLAADSPLRELPGVFLTPHAAFYSRESMDALQSLAADEIGRALRGTQLRSPVTPPRRSS